MAFRPLTFLLALGPVAGVAQEAPTLPPAPRDAEGHPLYSRLSDGPKPGEISKMTALVAGRNGASLDRVPGHVRVFNSNDIQSSGAHTLGEFLAYVLPGQAQSTGQPGQASTAYLGGSRPQDMQVLLDGVRITDPTAASVDLNMIPLVGIDRVEVISGGASARFGAHAMGGVVALYSAGTTGAGSHGDVLVGGGGQDKRGGVMPALGWDGGYMRLGATRYEDRPTVDATHVYRQGTVFGSFGQQLTERTKLTLSYRNFYQTVPLPFQVATPLEREYNPDRYAELHGNQAAVGLAFEVGPRFSWEVRLGLVALNRSDPPDADYPDGPQNRYDAKRYQAGLGFHWTLSPRWGFSVTVDGEEERATLPGYFGGEDQGRGRTTSLGLEVRYDLTPSVTLLAQGRQDWLTQRFSGADGHVAQLDAMRPGTFRLGLNKTFKWGLHAYAAVGSGYNTPLLLQTMENVRAGADPLATERSRFAQVGIALERGGWSLRLEAARTLYRDLITPNASTTTTGPVLDPIAGARQVSALARRADLPCIGGTGPNGIPLGFCNTGSYRVQGLESNLGYRTPWRIPVGVDAFVRNQDARDLTAPKGEEFGTPVVQNRPFTSHGLRLFAGGAKMRVETKWNRVGRRYESVHTFACSDLAPLVTPTYVSYDDLSMVTTYTYSRFFQVIVRGEHLLQKNFTVTDWQGRKTDLQNNAALLYGIPAPKPTVMVEMRYRY